jgi:hypothetical protein
MIIINIKKIIDLPIFIFEKDKYLVIIKNNTMINAYLANIGEAFDSKTTISS